MDIQYLVFLINYNEYGLPKTRSNRSLVGESLKIMANRITK